MLHQKLMMTGSTEEETYSPFQLLTAWFRLESDWLPPSGFWSRPVFLAYAFIEL